MTLYPIDNVLTDQKINELQDIIQRHADVYNWPALKEEVLASLTENLTIYSTLRDLMSEAFEMMMFDQDGYIVHIDDRFSSQLGYEKEELIYRHYRLLHAGVHDETFYEQMWKTLSHYNMWEGDICSKAKEGTMIWHRTKLVRMTDSLFVSFRIDINDVKNEESRVIEALNDDYAKVLQQLMNLVFRVQKNKQTGKYYFVLIEGKLSKKLNINSETIYNQSLDSLVEGEELACLISEIDKVFSGEEVVFKHRHGAHLLYSLVSPIVENGEVIEAVGSSVDITSLEEAEQRVKHLAFFDSLTDLPNRTKLREDLKIGVEKANDTQPFAILYCDIDRLKYINDTLGEYIGDQVIQVIAKRLKETLPTNSQLYRFGGDEFVVVINGSKAHADRVSEATLNKIKQPINIHGNEFFVTCSIGISFYGEDGVDAEGLMNHASIAVHYCKMTGRNNRLFYSPKMNNMYNDILFMEGELRKALYNDEFELFYQPQLDVATGEVTGLEALIRWPHKEKGNIPPSDFIPLAEETGLIVQLGEWVIKKACRQHVEWVDKGHNPIKIAVNVSAVELQRYDFADKVATIIEETNMNPTYLEIEITENSVMQNTEDCIQTMKALQKMGVSLSIDDFGTGYSSFGYLRKFPINYLKIDQSFVKNALEESSSAEIIKAMIQLAHTFGLKVVAEGVEEQPILDLLQQQQCDYYQGYFFSKPIPSNDLEKLLYNQRAV
ncbi:hypothetical protein Pryu01_02678 [Paraliobacillus ryukyuensis]|uniref:PAS domain S-box-containing protein/diguanylate cyclase (GGDEF)-like protein n=1 Tax=Paraliobacillus ryukyuensis TaxID=200904 RepID=A0A366E1Q0_9BACI|nr:EAL domain-containing protein [Paraliobacillus ryukyuensis]RBO95348.1 PAS domain S-box-containing protein/diguanylate cyclase (GGDEF)-like protein [Paraliobacillus ryukyuensis]